MPWWRKSWRKESTPPHAVLPTGAGACREPEIQRPGENTVEMRWCASQRWEESNQALKEQLEPTTLDKWKAATQEVCAAALPHADKELFTTDGRWMR